MLCIYVTGTKRGIWKLCNSLCVAGQGWQVEDAGRCAGMLAWLYCACTKVFPTKSAEADNSDIIRGCHSCPSDVYWSRNKKEVCTWLEALVLVLSLAQLFSLFPGWSIWKATDPLAQLPQCLSRSGIITRQGNVLYLFNCKCSRLTWVPWVSVF